MTLAELFVGDQILADEEAAALVSLLKRAIDAQPTDWEYGISCTA